MNTRNYVYGWRDDFGVNTLMKFDEIVGPSHDSKLVLTGRFTRAAIYLWTVSRPIEVEMFRYLKGTQSARNQKNTIRVWPKTKSERPTSQCVPLPLSRAERPRLGFKWFRPSAFGRFENYRFFGSNAWMHRINNLPVYSKFWTVTVKQT